LKAPIFASIDVGCEATITPPSVFAQFIADKNKKRAQAISAAQFMQQD